MGIEDSSQNPARVINFSLNRDAKLYRSSSEDGSRYRHPAIRLKRLEEKAKNEEQSE